MIILTTKEIKETMTETNKYITEDGMEFENKYTCELHEMKLKIPDAKKYLSLIPQIEADLPMRSCDEEEITTWYLVRNRTELEQLFRNLKNIYLGHLFNIENKKIIFPNWVAITQIDTYEAYYLTDYVSYLEKIDKFIDLF